MKNIYQISAFILIPAIAFLLAFSSGPPAGNTGSPLDGQNCTNCHQPGPATQAANLITTDIPGDGYTPGVTYEITVTALDIVSDRQGYQITSETATAKTGTFILIDQRSQLKSPTTVTHTSMGTTPVGNPNAWTMAWTAPESGTGTVTFYVAVNATNDDGTNSGDMIYVSSLNVVESTFGITENSFNNIGEVYPNPAQNHIKLNVPIKSSITIFDNSGREILNSISTQETEIIDVSQLVKGLYFVHIIHDGQTTNRRFIKL